MTTTIVKFQRLVQVQETQGTYPVPSFIREPKDVFTYLTEVLSLHDEPQEVFGIICLNTKNRVIGIDTISKGSLNAAIIHPREVFKVAIMRNSASIILFHNHPSGDTSPSPEDIEITDRLVKSGDIIGIDVLDHVIVADQSYLSLKERGNM